MKIAIVTFEFEGLTKNGGIGTAYRRLAELLRKDGHQVTVIFFPFDWAGKLKTSKKEIQATLGSLKAQGIRVSWPEHETSYGYVASDGFNHRRSLLAYEHLKRENFDVIHASDNCGLIYQSLLAKKAGIAFTKTRFVVGLHGAPFWTAEANGVFSESAITLSSLDRPSIEMCDYAISPSSYMVRYLKERGWKLPKKTLVIPNPNLLGKVANKAKVVKKVPTKPGDSNQKTIVFFGRLERRKGIFIFIEAIHSLLERCPMLTPESPLEVVFLGRDLQRIGPKLSQVIREQMNGHGERVRLKFHDDFSSEKSLTFLKSNPKHLVCMPSLVDNSPYVIVEAIEAGLDFLATKNGGQSELMRSQDARRILCEPTIESLASALEYRLFAKPIHVAPSRSCLNANSTWRLFHKRMSPARTQISKAPLPKISVVVGANRRCPIDEVAQTIHSILHQRYPNIELVVSKDIKQKFSKLAKLKRMRLKTFDSHSLEAHDLALETCTGKLVLFLDGGTFVEPTTLRQWATAANNIATDKTKRFGAFHGLVTKTYKYEDQVAFEITVASSDLLTRALTGLRTGSAFALWDRKALLKVAKEIDINFSSDTAARPVYSQLLAMKYEIGSAPFFAVHNCSSRYEPHPQSVDHVSVLSPFWKDNPEATTLYAYVAGLYQELYETRADHYVMRERIGLLEEMKSQIKGIVQ